MRFSVAVLTVFLAMMNLAAESAIYKPKIYIGCKGRGDRPGGIYSTTMEAGGKFGESKLEAATGNPSYLAISPVAPLLFSVSEDTGGAVSAWRIQPDGSLLLINTQSTGGEHPCHLSVTPSGRILLIANYSGGSIAAFKIHADGTLSEKTAFVKFTGSGTNKQRQEKPHAHGIYCDPEEKFVYVCDLGTDKVWIFRLDVVAGTLTANDPASVSLPPGSGPRHLAFGKNPEQVFVNNEMGLTVSALHRDLETGALKLLQTLPAFSGTGNPGDSTAEIVVHPSGKLLTVSTRGQNTLSTFQILADGTLTLVETVPAMVKKPRNFAISPKGDFLIAAGEDDDSCVVQTIDTETGHLSSTENRTDLPWPQCVLFGR